MLWGCFSAAGTEGFRVEEKLNAPKNLDSPNENPVQNIGLGRRYNEPKHTARVNVLEWPSLGLNAIKYFWRNLKMCLCPHPTWQTLRGEEVRRMADNCQMLMRKTCHIKQKKTWGCKGASGKSLFKCMNTYATQFQFFIFDQFKVVRIKNFLCQYGLWSVDSCGWGMNIFARHCIHLKYIFKLPCLFVVYYMLLSLCSVGYIIFILLGSFF